jgi:hypothetical protein
MLAAARVLKLIDEQVVNAVGEGEGCFAGVAVISLKNLQGRLRDLSEVELACLGECDVKLGGRMTEESEAGANGAPIVFGIAGGGQIADGAECGLKAVDFAE